MWLRTMRRLTRPRGLAVLGASLLAVLLLSGCGTGFTNLENQESFRRQEPPRLQFPAASVPNTGQPAALTEQEATAMQNPFAGNAEAAQAGAALYAVNCRQCHGDDLKGTGAIAQFFPPQPTDLTSDRIKTAPDGHIFWVITNGFGRMPGFGKVLSVDDRWRIVSYVRSVQQR